jgi:hypothetical protein
VFVIKGENMKKLSGKWIERNGAWFRRVRRWIWVRYQTIKCVVCGKDFLTQHYRGHGTTCSHKCGTQLRWNRFHDENPDRICKKRDHGYIYLIFPDKHTIAEHRYVMENHLKRKLAKNEHVHHINGDRSNNNLENLVLLTRSEHNSVHKKEQVKSRTRTSDGKFI